MYPLHTIAAQQSCFLLGDGMMERALIRARTVERPHEAAFLKAFDEHADALFRHATYRISDREKAKDLTQDTFIKAWDYVRGGGEVQQWKSFLFRVLNNSIIDEYRRKKEQSLDALFEHDPAHTSTYLAVDGRAERENALDDTLLIEKIRTLIPKLPEQQRVALTLRYIDGLSPKEVADALDISENAASVRIHRAVEQLKTLCAPLRIHL